MWNHQGRIAYRPRNRTSLRPTFERLENRSVLNGASLQMPPNSILGGIKLDNYGKRDSYETEGHGAGAADGRGLSPHGGSGVAETPMGLYLSDAALQSLGAGAHKVALSPTDTVVVIIAQANNGKLSLSTSADIGDTESQSNNDSDGASDGSHSVSKDDLHSGVDADSWNQFRHWANNRSGLTRNVADCCGRCFLDDQRGCAIAGSASTSNEVVDSRSVKSNCNGNSHPIQRRCLRESSRPTIGWRRDRFRRAGGGQLVDGRNEYDLHRPEACCQS